MAAAFPVTFNEAFSHHCAVCPEGAHTGNSSYKNCTKNPGHENFLTVADFMKERPKEDKLSEKEMDEIQNRIDRTVKVFAMYTSKNRPDAYPYPDRTIPYPLKERKGNYSNRFGTGYILGLVQIKTGAPCPCRDCRRSEDPKMEFWEFEIMTAAHVIFDDSEAEGAVFHLFYDSENDGESICYLYGTKVKVKVIDTHKIFSDRASVISVTHNPQLAKRLINLCDDRHDPDDFLSSHSDAVVLTCVDFMGNSERNKFPWENTYVSPFNETSIPNFYPTDRSYPMMISHPHGMSKKISLGKIGRIYKELSPSLTYTLRKELKYRILAQKSEQNYTQVGCVDEKDESLPIDRACPLRTNMIPPSQTDVDAKDQKLNEMKSGKPKSDYYDFLEGICNSKSVSNEFRMPFCMTVTFPRNADYHLVSDLGSRCWWSFTPGTKFTLPDGEGIPILKLKDLEFFATNPRGIFQNTEFEMSTLTYDLASCPGSSGAKVFDKLDKSRMFTRQHYGAWNGLSCSGPFVKFLWDRLFDDDDEEEEEEEGEDDD